MGSSILKSGQHQSSAINDPTKGYEIPTVCNDQLLIVEGGSTSDIGFPTGRHVYLRFPLVLLWRMVFTRVPANRDCVARPRLDRRRATRSNFHSAFVPIGTVGRILCSVLPSRNHLRDMRTSIVRDTTFRCPPIPQPSQFIRRKLVHDKRTAAQLRMRVSSTNADVVELGGGDASDGRLVCAGLGPPFVI